MTREREQAGVVAPWESRNTSLPRAAAPRLAAVPSAED